ncbi:hypothetical protein SDC9_170108 [bioreactor metagenome]|uniref:Uncharacterized protein n=1 Tax=bioreactor metagenome TaxID=1076179 RepID=A0A645G7X1_9ZZZZ
MLPHFLHDIPLLQRNQRLMGVHYQNLLAFWLSDELFVLVRKCGASQSRHVSEIDLVVENASDRAAAPGIWPHRVQPRMGRAGLAVIVICRCQHLFRCEDSGNLVRAFTRSTQFKDSSHHRRGFLIWNKILGVTILLSVAVRRSPAQTLTALGLHLFDGANLFAGILRVEFVRPIADGVEIITAFHQRIHAVIDGNKTDAFFRKIYFRVLSHLQVFTPKAAEILDD